MNKKALAKLTLIGIALIIGAPSVHADIYKFVDANGVTHFHNIPNLGDPRYKLYKRDGHSKTFTGVAPRYRPAAKFNTQNRQHFTPLIATAAQRYQVDETLLHAVIMAESGYNPRALSPKGAVGLMQLMPETAKRYGVTNINDPVQNIHGGTRYLSYLLQLFNNNLSLAIAAYNAGENAVIKYGNKIPPYQETTHYVAKVLAFYRGSKAEQLRPQKIAYAPAAR